MSYWRRRVHTGAGITARSVLLVLLGVTALPATELETPRASVELEAGPVWQSRNDVQIPNDTTGTRFSLVDLVGSGPWLGARVQLSWTVKGRHGMQLLLAPLSYTETGRFDEPVRFAGERFRENVPTEASYKFNSWRLSYRYQVVRGQRWLVWVGFTGKVRDAEIELRQGDTVSRDTDLGFVPLFLFEAEYKLAERWRLLMELDALAGGPGRAEDLALKIGYDLSDRWRLTGGYRMVEGGADVDEVYNFAWFHYAVVSMVYRF